MAMRNTALLAKLRKIRTDDQRLANLPGQIRSHVFEYRPNEDDDIQRAIQRLQINRWRVSALGYLNQRFPQIFARQERFAWEWFLRAVCSRLLSHGGVRFYITSNDDAGPRAEVFIAESSDREMRLLMSRELETMMGAPNPTSMTDLFETKQCEIRIIRRHKHAVPVALLQTIFHLMQRFDFPYEDQRRGADIDDALEDWIAHLRTIHEEIIIREGDRASIEDMFDLTNFVDYPLPIAIIPDAPMKEYQRHFFQCLQHQLRMRAFDVDRPVRRLTLEQFLEGYREIVD